MKKIFTLSLFFCLTFGFAQQKLKKADKLFADLSYIEAAKAYEVYLADETKPTIQTLMNVADSYYYVHDNKSALKWYQKLYDIQGNSISPLYRMRYIQSLKGVRDYEKADLLTQQYLKNKGVQKDIFHYVAQKKYLDSLLTAPPIYKIYNLSVNSNKSDFGASFYGDKIVYASSRDTTKFTNKLYTWNEQPYLKLYISERNGVNGEITNGEIFLPEIESRYHQATTTFSKDQATVYYTTNILKKRNKLWNDKSGTNNFQIIKGTIKEGKIIKEVSLPFNSKDYSVGHPSLSADGKWLFFVSDMPGGYGETDIYVVEIYEDGEMSAPKNLGSTINTIGREMFPFFSEGVLYFSSEGNQGLGGLDIFESRLVGKLDFSEPKNLGPIINSNGDDFAFIIDSTNAYGYISSNRTMGKGDDDIYYFTKSDPICNQLVSGKVTDRAKKTGIALATVKVFDAFGKITNEASTNSDGTYQLTIPCNATYKVIASKENYTSEEKEVIATKELSKEIKEVNFELINLNDLIVIEDDKEKIKVNPIFFNYDKSDITTQAAEELDKVVFVMDKFPNIKIKIESHTDSRGSDSYNLKLSDARAKSTQRYILSKNIDSGRIESAIGYGETVLRNGCSNGVKCSEVEHAVNRRSDFIIIEK